MGLAFAEMDDKDTAKREGMAGRECDIYLPVVSFERPLVYPLYSNIYLARPFSCLIYDIVGLTMSQHGKIRTKSK